MAELDLLMILSGEDRKERHRSKKAIELFNEFSRDVPILISGSHSGYLGRELPKGMKRECHQVADFLISQGVPSDKIVCEEYSLDTLGNFYFSHQLINPDQREIVLITDPFHMGRSKYCADLVFGDDKSFIPEPTNNPRGGTYTSFMEWIQKAIISRDMNRLSIGNGDYASLTKFMDKRHPFYCIGEPQKSSYGKFLAILGANKKFAKFLLPTQRQAYKN